MKSFIIFSLVIMLMVWLIEKLTGSSSFSLINSSKNTINSGLNTNAHQTWENIITLQSEYLEKKIDREFVQKETESNEGTFPKNTLKINQAEQNQQLQQSKQKFGNEIKLDFKKDLQKFEKIQISYKDYLKKIKPKQIIDDTYPQTSTHSEAYILREQNYKKTLEEINLHNSNLKKSFAMGLNKFVDLSHEQFKMKYPATLPPRRQLTVEPVKDDDKAKIKEKQKRKKYIQQLLGSTQVDLRTKDWVIYDTGNCISSYAFSALDTIWINNNNLRPDKKLQQFFSVQQIISCMRPVKQQDRNKVINGCKGGRASDVFMYVMRHGIISEVIYPYNLNTRQNGIPYKCDEQTKSRKSFKFFIRDYHIIQQNNCVEMVQMLLKNLTVTSVIISTPKLRTYSFGVYDANTLNSSVINSPGPIEYQSVVVVGYKPLVFIFKNSWGDDWGMHGYGYVGQNMGVCQYSSFPIFFS